MKKLDRYFLIGIGILLMFSVKTMTGQTFVPGGNTLDIGNIKTHAWADGYLFHDTSHVSGFVFQETGFEFPKGSGKTLLYLGGLWVAGTSATPTPSLGMAIQGWDEIQGDGKDFWPGPLTDQTALTDTPTVNAYNQVWKITRTQIDSFKADFADNGVVDNPQLYPLVYNWPAIGFDSNGDTVQATSPDGCTFYLAPFEDVNGDPSDYDPDQGDYPRIQGDMMLWWVFNDRGPGADRFSTTEGMGLEFHASMYAFDHPTSQVQNGVYLDYVMINRSTTTWNDVRLSTWTDLDLGNYADDYTGVDSNRHTITGYNSTNVDDPSNPNTAYTGVPPAVGITVVEGPWADLNDGIDNDRDGMIDEAGERIRLSNFTLYTNDFTPYGNPEADSLHHFVNYLNSRDKTGASFVDNYSNGGSGDGRAGSSPGPPTGFPFSGDICTTTGWTMGNAMMQARNYRMLGVMGAFTLTPGEVNQVGIIYSAAQNDTDHIGSVCDLYPTIDSLLFYYEEPLLGCVAPNLVYPGDTDHDQYVNAWDLLPIGVKFGQTGPIRPNATISWVGQNAPDWTDSLASGLNIKHVDTNGDGVIDNNDQHAITLNYAFQHNSLRPSKADGIPLLADFAAGPHNPGDTLIIEIKLGNIDTIAQDIYGIAFSMNYDTSLVEPGGVAIKFDNTWMGTEGIDLLTLYEDRFELGQVDISEVRNNQMNVSGFGQIATMIVVLDDDIAKKDIPFSLNIRPTAQLIDADEASIPLSLKTTTADIATTSISELHELGIDIYPNPSREFVNVHSHHTTLKTIRLMNLAGQFVHREELPDAISEAQLNISAYAPGLYFLQIETHKGIGTTLLQIMK